VCVRWGVGWGAGAGGVGGREAKAPSTRVAWQDKQQFCCKPIGLVLPTLHCTPHHICTRYHMALTITLPPLAPQPVPAALSYLHTRQAWCLND
jgi:hypothetical protein